MREWPGTVSEGEHGTNPQQLVSLSLYQLLIPARGQQKQIPPTSKMNTLICVPHRLYTQRNTEAGNEACYRGSRLAADRNALKLKPDQKKPNQKNQTALCSRCHLRLSVQTFCVEKNFCRILVQFTYI